VWAGSRGGGPFTALPPGENVLALQIFLSVVAIPLLCLSAAIQERRHTEAVLHERLRFEELLSRLSSAFVHLPADQMDEALHAWLGRLGEFLGADRLALLRLSEDNQILSVSHSWAAAGVEVLPPRIATRRFPEAIRWLLADAPFVFSHAEATPPAAACERDTERSNLTIPLLASGRVVGGIVFDSLARSPVLQGMMPQLRLVAEVFGSALASKEAEDALRASESMKSAILASLTTSVAVLDREGRIIAVNEQWTRHACKHDMIADAGGAVGANYLSVWRQAALEGRLHAKEALAGIDAVLAGSEAAYSVEYPCSGSPDEQWWAMSVVPLTRPEGGAVVSQTDVTERKRVEIEAQHARQELAHYTRVSTMGELTASLAHELNQPLTGILANAQAAQRFLDVTPPDVDELRAILSDIVDDDRRASEVIHRLRDLLMKREPEFRALDLNLLIRDVVRLLSSDALIRNVTVALDLAPDLPVVNGDRVQLQQVILNLLLNAMEAMSDNGGGHRAVVVRTENLEGIHVSVQDEGPGLRPGTHELVFQPFYTTKSAGMGMGLAIARSIIEAHAGLIWVTGNPARGATFHFALPSQERGPQ
jgi:two-component system, LuxR family, sensor kinase FixL